MLLFSQSERRMIEVAFPGVFLLYSSRILEKINNLSQNGGPPARVARRHRHFALKNFGWSLSQSHTALCKIARRSNFLTNQRKAYCFFLCEFIEWQFPESKDMEERSRSMFSSEKLGPLTYIFILRTSTIKIFGFLSFKITLFHKNWFSINAVIIF